NSGGPRTGTVVAAGLPHIVIQSGCTYAISPATNAFPVAGGFTNNLTVTTAGSCPWTAGTTDSWIFVSSAGITNTGNGTVSYFVSSNSGGPRSGTILVAGLTHTVLQAAPPFIQWQLDNF